MDALEFASTVLEHLPYEPTSQQIEVVAALARFCSANTPSDTVFLLNGYAGTGKTSLCAALVRSLNNVGIGTVLLAPTGRAAKVFSAFAHHPAYTIHRRIYSVGGNGLSTERSVRLAENRSVNTVFLVDEASMISGDSSSGNLLENLVHYVYSGVNCRLVLIGDTAQLPPVGCEDSPAMNVKTLRSIGLRVNRAVLTATVRQASDSGILWNATWLRRAMRVDPLPTPVLRASQFEDVTVVDGEDLEDVLNEAYALDGVGETTLITRSNMRATQFNLAIRSRILYYEEELCHEDLLLVSKNNYYWSKDVKGLDFIANGDTALVEKVYGTEMRYDMRFADVRLRFPDRDITLDCKIMLDPLVSEEAAVGRQQMLALYEAIIADPSDPEQSAATRAANALKSPYINALQVKYAYAVTCHKSQGGQWRNVFIDLGYIPPEAMGMDFYRWLYTAITRATTKLYLLNPSVTVK
jgi:exodeoxyribonuclease-5